MTTGTGHPPVIVTLVALAEKIREHVCFVVEHNHCSTLDDESLQKIADTCSCLIPQIERVDSWFTADVKEEVIPYSQWINGSLRPMISAWHAEVTYRQRAIVREQAWRVARAYLDSDLPSPCPNTPRRRPIAPSVRFEVLRRAGHTCQSCGAKASDGAQLHIDHIHPVSKGGTNDLANLQALCRDCNLGKGDRIL